MNRRRQHHFVQARYLEGFVMAPNEMLWCYGRKRLAPYAALPDNLARQRDFYNLPNSKSGENLEEFLEKFVETPGLAALRRLIAEAKAPSFEDRVHLAKYIAFQETRVPFMRDRMKKQMLHEARNMVRRFQETGGTKAESHVFASIGGKPVAAADPVVISREEAEDYLRELESNPKTFDLTAMVDLAMDATTFLAQMRWTVMTAPKNSAFITSDSPVFRMFLDDSDPSDALLRPDCRIVCPLSGGALLVMEHDFEFLRDASRPAAGRERRLPETRFVSAKDADVAYFNRAVVENSNLWCFSGSKQDWIITAMQGRSKRAELHLYAEKNLTSGHWIRPQQGEASRG